MKSTKNSKLGGNPLNIEGFMYLCGRADLNEDRFFPGSIAHLTFFDEALTLSEVRTLRKADGDPNIAFASLLPSEIEGQPGMFQEWKVTKYNSTKVESESFFFWSTCEKGNRKSRRSDA